MTNKPAASTLLAWTVVAGLVTLSAQQGARSGPAFDVASVKRFVPSPDRRQTDAISVMPGGRFTAPSATMRGLIMAAYGLQDLQIVDSERRLTNDRFEVEARTSPDVSLDDARAMLRTLLAERFGLAVRRETRELAVYIMTAARTDRRLGDQLRPAGPECAAVTGPPGLKAPPPPPRSEPIPGRVLTLSGPPLRCGGLRYSSSNGEHISLRDLTMPIVAERLTGLVGRPILDRTGLDGRFDLDLTYTPDGQVDTPISQNAPTVMTAIREQLGLRLESVREPVEVLIVDAVAPPSEN
jgi:uncharacterized protein (TIGR03435 family)